ncbi:MAG: hypothetical protein ACP5OV_04760 [Acidimicrobiales bacterium]
MGWYSRATVAGDPVMGLGVSADAAPWPLVPFAVPDVVAALSRAVELGATVVRAPQDVADLGTTAIVRDPVGGTTGPWQAGAFAGFGQMFEAGAPGWFDHLSRDGAAVAFYGGLTGATLAAPDLPMRILAHHERWFASPTKRADAGDARWMPVFGAGDLDAARATTVAEGGSVLVPEMPVPGTVITVVADPVVRASWTLMARGTP